jgi:HlyD family secretion protein
MVPANRPVIALLPPANIKVRFFVPEAILPTIAIGSAVRVRCDGCAEPIVARISFIARAAEFTPPVIYSLEERAKLVFLVEARTQTPERLRVGQPVSVALGDAASQSR